MQQILKRKSDQKVSNWSGGSTTELLIYPDGSAYNDRNFDVRISSATVEDSPSNFTVLTGYNRILMPLAAPLGLCIDGGQSVKINPFETFSFDGASKTVSTGVCTDIGVMFKRGYSCNIQNIGATKAGDAAGKDIAKHYMDSLYSSQNICSKCNLFTCIYVLCDGVTAASDNQSHALNKGDFLIIKEDVAQNNSGGLIITKEIDQKEASKLAKPIEHRLDKPFALVFHIQKPTL